MGPEQNAAEYGAITFQVFDSVQILLMETVQCESIIGKSICRRNFKAPVPFESPKLTAKCKVSKSVKTASVLGWSRSDERRPLFCWTDLWTGRTPCAVDPELHSSLPAANNGLPAKVGLSRFESEVERKCAEAGDRPIPTIRLSRIPPAYLDHRCWTMESCRDRESSESSFPRASIRRQSHHR
jgi:hypothetical protein